MRLILDNRSLMEFTDMTAHSFRLDAIRAAVICCFAVLAACGGGESSTVLVPPPPPPPPMQAVTVQQVFPQLPGFTQPVALMQAPGDSTRWFAVEQRGIIHSFTNDPNVNSTSGFLNISVQVDSSFGESGLLGMAFHPSWPATAFVYVHYTVTGGPLGSRISRFQSTDGGLTVMAASEQIVLEMPQPFSNHNGGNLAFGPDGFLYAAFGDGGSGGDPQENGQNQNNLLGTIIRLDINSAAPYAIPPLNPNALNPICTMGFGVLPCPEIFAYGLRNPWKFSFDSATGDLWVGDVGQGAWEEVDRVELGMNYGWNDREGAHCFDPPAACRTAGLAEPITEYGRALGASITGGFVYRGTAIAGLVGQYVFADFVSGRIFSVPATSQPTVGPTELDDTGLQFAFSALAEDINGELYLVHYSGGTIYQLVAAP